MTCPFYRIDKVIVERRRIIRDGVGSQPPALPAPWCAHLYSPVSKYVATHIVGGANQLRCGGDLDKCHIPLVLAPKH